MSNDIYLHGERSFDEVVGEDGRLRVEARPLDPDLGVECALRQKGRGAPAE